MTPDDEETTQYRNLCEAVGLRVGQRPPAEVYRQAVQRIADLWELRDLYRQRSDADRLLKRTELWIALSVGVVVGAATSLVEDFLHGGW
jgi:hypothetical protein